MEHWSSRHVESIKKQHHAGGQQSFIKRLIMNRMSVCLIRAEWMRNGGKSDTIDWTHVWTCCFNRNPVALLSLLSEDYHHIHLLESFLRGAVVLTRSRDIWVFRPLFSSSRRHEEATRPLLPISWSAQCSHCVKALWICSLVRCCAAPLLQGHTLTTAHCNLSLSVSASNHRQAL